MKIAVFSENFYPELSGIADSIMLLGRELAVRGHDVRYYAPAYSRANYRHIGAAGDPDLGPRRSVERFFSFPFPAPSGQGRLVIPYGGRTLSIRRFAPDVLHTQLLGGVGLEALIAARILKKPLVGTNHTAIQEFVKWGMPPLERAACRAWNWYYERCDLVTAPSESVFTEMAQFGFEHAQQIVVSNPLDTETFRPQETKIRFPKHTFLYAGRLAPEKDLETILRALPMIRREFPDVLFAVAGRGPHEAKLRALAQGLKIASAVKFLGFLTPQQLAETMNAVSFFAMMSTSETQSLGTMQALACGRPVVAARARALPEYVGKHNGILVEPGDHGGFAQAAGALFRNPSLARRLGEGGFAGAQGYSAPRIAERWERIYEEAVSAYNRGT